MRMYPPSLPGYLPGQDAATQATEAVNTHLPVAREQLSALYNETEEALTDLNQQMSESAALAMLVGEYCDPDVRVRLLRPSQTGKAGRIIRKLLGGEYKPGVPFDKEQIRHIMRALVAHDESECKEAFRIIAATRPP